MEEALADGHFDDNGLLQIPDSEKHKYDFGPCQEPGSNRHNPYFQGEVFVSAAVEHAKRELKAINFGEEDTIVMLDILQRFYKQWDSGGSVSVVVPILQRLLERKPLTPLTGEGQRGLFRRKVVYILRTYVATSSYGPGWTGFRQ
jgi:hypothetical protein